MGTRRGGRPQVIDEARIVDAAIEIGIDSLSMSAVARLLGVSTTALYRYVSSREALLDLCMDSFCERVELPEEDAHWRDYLADLSRSFRSVLHTMPGTAQYAFKLGPSTMSALHIVDRSLGFLLKAGFDGALAWQSYVAVIDHAITSVQKEELAHSNPESYRIIKDQMSPAFLSITKVLMDVLPADFEAGFETRLEMLLDGIEVTLKQQQCR